MPSFDDVTYRSMAVADLSRQSNRPIAAEQVAVYRSLGPSSGIKFDIDESAIGYGSDTASEASTADEDDEMGKQNRKKRRTAIETLAQEHVQRHVPVHQRRRHRVEFGIRRLPL